MRRAVWTLGVLLVVAVAGGAWWWNHLGDLTSTTETEFHVDAPAVEQTSKRTAELAQLPNPQPRTDADHDVIPSVEDLAYLCPNPWSAMGDDCAAALDHRYLLEPVSLAKLHNDEFGWEPPAAPPAFDGVSWQQVFADPDRTFRAAMDALSRVQCRVPEGETRVDLRDTCSADEVAKLAILQTACVMPLVHHGVSNPWLAPGEENTWSGPTDTQIEDTWRSTAELLDQDTSLTAAEYWQHRTELEDARFRFAWRLMRCERVPRQALAWLDVLPTPSGHPDDQHQGRPLTEIAARLGSDWARLELAQDKQIRQERGRRRIERWMRDNNVKLAPGTSLPEELFGNDPAPP